MFKKLFACSCAFSLTFTSIPLYAQETTASSPNEEFTAFLEKDFKETMEDSYTTMHSYVSNPENLGISTDDIEISLGSFISDKEDKKELEEEIQELEAFDRNSLDALQQNIYDEYKSTYDSNKELNKSKYQYLANIWSENDGVPVTLNNYFANFDIYSEYDVQAFITLLKDTKRYTKEAISYSKKQAEKELLSFDYKTTIKSINSTLKNKDENEIQNNIDKEIDKLSLDSDTAQSYKDQVQSALDEVYYPSFRYMKKELKKLKDDNQEARPITSLKNGKKYYELTVQSQASSSKSPKKIYKELLNAYNDAGKRINKNSKKLDNLSSTSFTSTDEILAFLVQNYTQNMPEITVPDYDIQNLPDEQTSAGIIAYYQTPVLDENNTNRIRFNAKDFGSDLSSIDTYTTFAHEGIPGHMYQYNYLKEHNTYNVQYLINELAFTEGFAEFAAKEALEYLPDFDQETAKLYMDNADTSYYLMAIFDLDIHLNQLSKDEFIEKYEESFDSSSLSSFYESICYEPCVYIPYSYGYYEICSLQEKAQKALGDAYDNKAFVSVLLQDGEVTFDVLEKNVDTYIKGAKA